MTNIEFLESFDENKVQTNIQTCFCNNVNVFRFTYDQYNAYLLDKGDFLQKMNKSNLWGFHRNPENQSEKMMQQASPFCWNFIAATQNGTQ